MPRLDKRLVAVGAVALAAALVATVTPAWAIIGGTMSDPADYPYFVKIDTPSSRCGGSLISDSWVLTAADCVESRLPTAHVTGRGALPVREIRVHPLYDPDNEPGRHNLALLRLDPGAAAGVPTVQVGAPLNPGPYAANTEAMIMGHGTTAWGTMADDVFRVADVPIRSDDYMDDIYNPWTGWDEWHEQLMIGAGRTGETTCYGDYGGPLVVNRDGTIVQVGVASIARGAGGSFECSVPGTFAELDGPQLAWVASVVPSIMQRWGRCTRPDGQLGYFNSYYYYSPLTGTDGPYHWSISCPMPAPPPPPDEPEGPAPEICRRKPWLCED